MQANIRIRAGELGVLLFRNNVGACVDDTGRLIRYGLANDSAQMSKRIKSGDLVGLIPVEVTTYSIHAQRLKLGCFISVECKRSNWHGGYPNPIDPSKFNAREQAQQHWIDIIRAQGGIAGFARCPEEFEALLST